MDRFKRYGLFVVPDGDLFAAGSAWLGWDSEVGTALAHPKVSGLPATPEDLTATPRKYGFHGTIKPPFALVAGMTVDMLDAAARTFCETRAPVVIPALEVRRLGGFIAIIPAEPSDALAELAAATVQALDPFRAPASEGELARRRKAGLTERQEALLQQWGYPYVLEEFRFHLTLTGRAPNADATRDALAAHFAPVLPAPFTVASLALMGEDAKGVFHLIHRYTLAA